MKRLYLMMGVLVLLLIPTGAVLADSHETVIEAGEVINNDVIVFDGDVVIESGAEVNGDVIVFNGDAELAGAVNGDVVLFNGDMEAGDAASISGDCVLLNGDLSGSAEAELSCTQVGANGFGAFINGIDGDVVVPPVPPVPPVPAVPAVPDVPNEPGNPAEIDSPPIAPRAQGRDGGDFFGNLLSVVSSTVMAGLVALVAVGVFPNQLMQVRQTVREKPAASGAIGLLTAVAVPSIAVLLTIISAVLVIVCIGLLGFPIVLLMMLAFMLALMLGWVAVGSWLGQRLFAKRFSPLWNTVLGTMLMTFGLGLIGIVPFMFGESLLALVISAVGLGAVTLTQFGTKPYPPDADDAFVEEDVEEDAEKVSAVMETLHIEIDDEGGLS